MKRILILLACTSALLLGACGKDSPLPVATGKATIRAINAIPTSPEIAFLIEELAIGTVSYQAMSPQAEYDDLDYTFNFDVLYIGESNPRRVARRHIDVEADTDYTMLLSGTLANPTITVWESAEREFDAAETVFQAQFANATTGLTNVDFYLAAEADLPAIGDLVATTAFGEVSTPADFAEGNYVLTITTAGDANAIQYVSNVTTFLARTAFFITAFDSNASETAAVSVRALGTLSTSFGMPDPGFPPTAEFINVAQDLGISDIYNDELLTSLIVEDHDYLDVSTEQNIAVGENTFYYTPANQTTGVTLEGTMTGFGGRRHRVFATGVAGALAMTAVIPDRVPVESHVKLLPYHASNHYDFLNIFAVEPGTSIDDAFPVRPVLSKLQPPSPVPMPAGSYDIYVTESAENMVLAGPFSVNVNVGDIIDMVIVDTADPAVLDVLFLSGGPVP